MRKTYTATPEDINREWVLIDAKNLVLGRLAAEISMRLRGKHKPSYTPHMNMGDHVVIINAEKVKLTGKKSENKTYYRHTGFPGGIKKAIAGKILGGDHPERVLFKAVQRMITRNPLGRQQLKSLHIYAGSEHPHTAQEPKVLDFASKNKKNTNYDN